MRNFVAQKPPAPESDDVLIWFYEVAASVMGIQARSFFLTSVEPLMNSAFTINNEYCLKSIRS